MQRLLLLVVVVLGGSVTANAYLWRRHQALSERVALLERKPGASTPSDAVPGPSSLVPRRDEQSSPLVAPDGGRETRDERREPSARRTETAGSADDALTPAQKAAVAREVERQLKEQGAAGHKFPRPMTADQLLAMLEKELGLSESQKTRISEIWKQRDAEMRKMVDGGEFPPPKKLMEVQDRYHEAVKRELDIAQQQKYDDLKKQGKLMGGGMVVAFEVGDDDPPK
jgi:hypothetical protein